MTRHVDQHSVGILQIRNQDWVGLGSGTCVELGGHYFVATAAHVLRSGADRVPVEEVFLVINNQENSTENGHRPSAFGTRGGGDYDSVDVAWMELDSATARRTGKSFVWLDRLEPYARPQPNEGLVFWGSPSERIQRIERGRNRMLTVRFNAFMTTRLEDGHAAVRHYDEDVDLLLSYRRGSEPMVSCDGAPTELADPAGMSGGGLWRINYRKTGLWSPDRSAFIGIEHAYSGEGGYVRGTQIQHWLKLLADDFPALRTQIEEYLQLHREPVATSNR